MSTHANMVKMTVSSVGADPYTITLNAASSGFQSFADAYGANATVDILITQGTVWEVARNCTYTHSGTTVTRGTLEDSSTGSRITTFDNTAVVSVVATAHMGNVTDLSTKGAIQGLEISYSSTTAIAVAAGTCAVNGKLLTYAGGTLTSGSTWKDNNNSTVTIGASKAYYVYAFDNAGTLEIRVQDYAAATYGGAPTWDSAYDYWKAPSVGAQARRIGTFWTDGSGNIIKFWWKFFGRNRCMFVGRDKVLLLNAGSSTTMASITITPYVGADVSAYPLIFGAYDNVSGATIGVYISVDSGTTEINLLRSYMNALGTGGYVSVPGIPNTGTLHYRGEATDTRSTIILNGVELFV